MKTRIPIFTIAALLFVSCSKDEQGGSSTTFFEDLEFSSATPYFATDGSMTQPVSEAQAQAVSSTIDISYFYNYDYTEPGFLDPSTRSQNWYWDDYYEPWLNNAVETRFYRTLLSTTEFDAAKTSQNKIAEYFADTSLVWLAPHAIFPTGSCIGGRQSFNPTSVTLAKGRVFGFKNLSTGKRGLMQIRLSQGTGWPLAFFDDATRVDIIKEN